MSLTIIYPIRAGDEAGDEAGRLREDRLSWNQKSYLYKGPWAGGSYHDLLSSPAVRGELGLTDDQIKKLQSEPLKSLAREFRELSVKLRRFQVMLLKKDV